ncbi:MAG: S8 family serine peptidase [Anaerolineaceae bacterium]
MNETQSQMEHVKRFSPTRKTSPGTILLIIFSSLWVISFSLLDLFTRWGVEQTMFETEVGITDLRWLIHLGYGILVFLPLLGIYYAVKAPQIRRMFGLWLIGGLFVLLSVPVKALYLTAQIQSSLLLILTLAVLIAVLFLISKRDSAGRQGMPKSSLMGTALLAGAGLTTPWLLWGALGSPLETLTVLVLGAVFGVFVVQSIFPFYLEKTQLPAEKITRGQFLLDGFTIAVFLLILVTCLSQNGSQLLLCLTLPVSGWLLAGLAASGARRNDHGRLAVGFISALSLCLPLAFFDMDELALIIEGSTQGEVLYWSQRAGTYSLLYLATISILILVIFHLREKANLEKRINIGLIVLSLMESIILYAFAGQPGFFGDRLFVIMKEQYDFQTASEIDDLSARKLDMYTGLTSVADQSQTDIREKLDRLHIDYTPYYLVNALEVNADWYLFRTLSQWTGVDRVLESPRLRPLPAQPPVSEGDVFVPPEETPWNLDVIHVSQVHEELAVKGEGVVIGQTDSGVDGNHPELKENYRGSGGANDFNWLDPWNKSVSPTDVGGHGTGTLGIMVGKTLGIAPQSQWIGCVNLARNLGNPAVYLDCMQFMFAPYAQGGDPFKHGDPLKGAMIINNSWGCPRVEGCDPQVFEEAVKVLKVAGIFMSVAAGNNGLYGCTTITDPPSIYGDVFTVGAIDNRKEISSFSSRGPVEVDGSGRVKPDLLAPGEQILIAAPGGTYTYSSGTSFAAPHVSGVVALMWSANPQLIGKIDETVQILRETAQPYTGTLTGCDGKENEAGAGILDAYAAVKKALEFKR